MIRRMRGDVTAAGADVIAHQVNCQGTMGKGLAASIREKYPYAEQVYKKTCRQFASYNDPSRRGDPNDHDHPLMGTCQLVLGQQSPKVYVANLYSQKWYGYRGCYTDYTALGKSLHMLHLQMQENDLHVLALPDKLGCGLAGGDWKTVSRMIEDEFGSDEAITCSIVTYDPAAAQPDIEKDDTLDLGGFGW